MLILAQLMKIVFTISATDVIEKLSTTTDVDGDTLTIDNLKLVEGEGTLTHNIDGSYILLLQKIIMEIFP